MKEKKTVKLTDESGKVIEMELKPEVDTASPPLPAPPQPKSHHVDVEGGIKEIRTMVAELGGEIARMSALMKGYDQGHRTGYKEGFADGWRFLVKKAEEMAAKHLKFKSRQALLDADALPTWWIATLALDLYEPFPEKGPEQPVPPTTKREEHGRKS